MPSLGTSRRALLAVSALTAVTTFATTASAQTTQAQAADAQSGLQDIVVTAQRRSENMQKVPISLTAVSGADLERLSIQAPKDIQFATPGLTFPEDNGTVNPYIRGRGTGYAGNGLEGSVAIYVDDVYSQSQFGTGGLSDVSQIQVLKGPQGTLYGRNATGGAILIKTNDPTHERGGYVEAGYGKLNTWHATTVLNLPVSSTLAVRLVGKHEQRDNYIFNTGPGRDLGHYQRDNVRIKALWEPTPEFTALASADWQHFESDVIRAQRIDGTGQLTGLGFYQTIATGMEDDPQKATVFATNLRLTYQADQFTATSITGYRSVRFRNCTENDMIAAYVQNFCLWTPPFMNYRDPITGGVYSKTFSQELRINTKLDGPLNFTLGAVYQNSKDNFPGVIGSPLLSGLVPIFNNFVNLQSIAVYGEAYYQITPRLKLTAGARWSKDSRQLFVKNNSDLQLAFQIPAQFFEPTVRQRASFSNVTPRVVLNYDAGDANFYASYNKGFKAGGFNVPAFATQVPLSPETIDSFEIGAKFKLFDNRVRLDLAAFTAKSKNVQVASVDTKSSGVIQQNAAGVKAEGGEASLTIAAAKGLTLNVGAAYLRSRFTKFDAASVFAIDPVKGWLVSASENLAGRQTTNSPEFTANGSISYEAEFNGGWVANFTASGRYSSSYDFQAGAGGPLRADRQKAFGLVNLTGNFITPDKHVTVSWYVDNVFGVHYYDMMQTGGSTFPPLFGAKAGGQYVIPALPRTFGGAIRYTF